EELASLMFVSGAKVGDQIFDRDVLGTSVDLSGVTSLSGAYVFSNCSALSEVVWGTRSSVPAYFFADCTGLEKLANSSGEDTSASITSIGEYAFYGCTALDTFTLNYTLTSLPAHAFDGCSAVTLDISHITSVGSYALSHCGIAEGSTTEQITSLSEGAFAYSKIKSFTMGSSLERSIPAYAFRGSSLSSFTPAKASSTFTIGKAAFAGCSELKSFSLGSLYSSTPSKTTIPILNDYAFAGSGITEFTYNISFNINSAAWGSYVFAYCADLTTVTLDTGSYGLSVYPYMFAYCTNLETVTLRDVSTMIIWDGAFQYCTAMEEITITNMKLCAWPSTSAAADAGTMETGIFDGWGTTNLTQYINVTTSNTGNNWDGGIGSNVVYGAKP
ncbi:MAG: leucine-rich repeat domain-containing protein, partial [Bacteroidales bacterium]|nr:leucine-rich repeat domain-containing protein [Bacteroidales bacterium]